MATIATINGVTYTDDDFNAVNYANKFQQLVGDIYEHLATKFAGTGTGILTIGTGSKSLTVSNLSSANLAYCLGQWVYLHPQSVSGVTPAFIKNYMLGVVTAVGTNSLTVNVIIAHGSGTYNSYYISYAGEINQAPGTVSVSNGGTGTTAAVSARANIGFGDPGTRAHVIYDDFCGKFDRATNWEGWIGEYFYARVDGAGAELITHPQGVYPGDDFMFNLDPRNDGLIPQNDWSSRPGVIGLSAVPAGALLNMYLRDASSETGNGANGVINFPYSGDVLEFSFMIPVGESFSENNAAGFSIGCVMAPLTGLVYVVNIGHGGALPFGNPLSPSPNQPPPSVLGRYDAMSVFMYDIISPSPPGDPVVYTNNGSQTTYWSPIPGTWYKVRMTQTSVSVYRDGAILMTTISGWSAPTMDQTNPPKFFIGFNKTSGSGRATVLLDYVYCRHPITAR